MRSGSSWCWQVFDWQREAAPCCLLSSSSFSIQGCEAGYWAKNARKVILFITDWYYKWRASVCLTLWGGVMWNLRHAQVNICSRIIHWIIKSSNTQSIIFVFRFSNVTYWKRSKKRKTSPLIHCFSLLFFPKEHQGCTMINWNDTNNIKGCSVKDRQGRGIQKFIAHLKGKYPFSVPCKATWWVIKATQGNGAK